MEAGKLRHRITIEKPTDVQGDDYGEARLEWAAYATRWASIEPLMGKEVESAGKIVANATAKIRLRHIEGVTEKMRVKFRDRYFNIGAVINVMEQNIETHLLVTERK